jgi:hypothetical protein
MDDLQKNAAKMAIRPTHEPVDLPSAKSIRKRMPQIFLGDLAVSSIDVIGDPGQSVCQIVRDAKRQGLNHRDAQANHDVNQVVSRSRTRFSHEVTPLTITEKVQQKETEN